MTTKAAQFRQGNSNTVEFPSALLPLKRGLTKLSPLRKEFSHLQENQNPVETGMAIDQQTYHTRRKQTKYLVGFEDFEFAVADQIKSNSVGISELSNSFKELSKEIFDYKRYIELS